MNKENIISLHLSPQFVKQTEVKEKFFTRDGVFEGYMHPSQCILRNKFDYLPLYTMLYAPTGTGKSYGFTFPVLNNSGLNKKRGLLILPTNTLIDELHENFSETFKQLTIKKLTGKSLDEAEKKGSAKRWEYCLDIASESDVTITNPDILNYAMHGGYDKNIRNNMERWFKKRWKNSGGKSFIELLKAFDYFVFDEFHLYDEEQIANILTMVKLREFFIEKSARILFVSATPERKLEDVFEKEGITFQPIEQCLSKEKSLSKKHYTILEEKITDEDKQARKIRGAMEVEIVMDDNFMDVITYYTSEIKKRLANQEKVLIVFNALHILNKLKPEIADLFGSDKIKVVSGYHQLTEEDKTHPIILATSKVEVGANFGVDFGLMQTGFNSRSCIQRFGRYARGGKTGKVIIHFDSSFKGGEKSITSCFNLLKRHLKSIENLPNIDYNSFVELLRVSLDSPKFYTEKIPMLYGEYLFAISKNFTENNNYETARLFEDIVKPEQLSKESKTRFDYFRKIDISINELAKQFPKEGNEWKKWWDNYLETYLTFRGSMPNISVIDKEEGDMKTEYSLEWILTHKDVIEKTEDEQGNKVLVVDKMLEERNTDIQYEILTMPYIGAEQRRFLDYSERKKPNEAFKKRLKALSDKGSGRSSSPFRVEQKKIGQLLRGLSKTFSEKRFKVADIEGSDRNFV